MTEYPIERIINDITGLVLQVAATGLPVWFQIAANYAGGFAGHDERCLISVSVHKSKATVGKVLPDFHEDALLLETDSEEHNQEALLDLFNKLAAFVAGVNESTEIPF